MIEPVSSINTPQKAGKQNTQRKESVRESSAVVRYADSFVSHSIDSAPVLSGLTLIWSFLDKSQGIPFKKALSNNIKRFFLPVMLVTSAVTAFLENKKMNKKVN